MATLDQIGQFAFGNPPLRQRFQRARIQAAWNILGEASPSAARVKWRNKVFSGEDDLDFEYRWVLSHPNIQTAGDTVTDANLVAATMSFVDAWAAVT